MSQSDFVTKGQALVASGQFQEAVKVCRLGLLGRPTTVEGRIVLGQALLALKRYDEVLAEMRVALDLDQSSVAAQTLKGEALIRKGDLAAAVDVLTRAQGAAPRDKRIADLIVEATRAGGFKPMTASHPSVGYVGNAVDAEPSESFTKHYPNHGADQEPTGDDGVGGFTRPTSIAAPSSKKRSNRVQAMGQGRSDFAEIPSAEVLAVGDKSGTMEAEMLEDDDDEDFGEVAPPPGSGPYQAARPAPVRGAVVKAAPRPDPMALRAQMRGRGDLSAVELDSQDMIALDDLSSAPRELPSMTSKGYGAGPGPGTKVREAVKLPSGPIDLPPPVASVRPTAIGPAMMPPLAQQIAQAPHLMQTMAPMQHNGLAPPASPAALRQTMIAPGQPPPMMNPQQAQSAAAVDALFQGEQQAPAWAHSTVVAGSPAHVGQPHPNMMPAPVDPRGPQPPAAAAPAAWVDPAAAPSAKLKRKRSKLAVVLWILIGGAVIGGGVFAGFQIRAVRLHKQIAAARNQAVDLAKADTWKGWSGARDRLAGIAQASGTVDNRAALARARAVLAYEFGDGLAETQKAVTKLAGQGGGDAAIAHAYLALAQSDPKAAKAASDKAQTAAPKDAAGLYVAGQAAVLDGDFKKATTDLKAAFDLEARPLYAVALGRALAQTNAWTDAMAAVDRALALMPDHPEALIQKAFIAVRAGVIASGNSQTSELRVMLQKLVAEGNEPFPAQTRGVAPVQLALAHLALAQVEFALKNPQGSQAAITAASKVLSDEQRFGEEALETLYYVGALAEAEAAAGRLRTAWPSSRSGRIAQGQILIARGKPAEALDVLTPDTVVLPRGLAVRGTAKLALGDLEGAKADFDAALKKTPMLELAVQGRAWVLIAENDVSGARTAIEPKFNPNTASAASAVLFAAILRRSAEPADRDKAKTILEKVIAGPAYVDVPRAHLELGRMQRDIGDIAAARAEITAAIKGGLTDATLELAEVQIDDGKPQEGRDTIDAMLKANKNGTSPALLLAGARAFMLVGEHARAAELLDQADKATSVVRWQADRERGRLLFRKADMAGAAVLLSKALDSSEADRDTLLLATDIASADLKNQGALATKVKAVAQARFKGTAEEKIVDGKLALAAEKPADAYAAYTAAVQLLGEKVSATRLAQVHFGLAITAYYNNDEKEMKAQLDRTLAEDPSLFTAYLFAGQIADAQPAEAIKFAMKATRYNPDNVDAWLMYGSLGARTKNKEALESAIAALTKIAPTGDELAELQKLKK